MLHHWFKSFQLDELRIFIHPRYVNLSRSRRNWRLYFASNIIANTRIDLADSHLHNQKAQWDGVIGTLNDTLNLPEWQNTLVTIVLSDHFVRYTTIPNHQNLSSLVEQQAYVLHCFNLAFGEQISGWNVQVSHGFDKASLASAVPQDLLQALLDTLQAQQLNVKAVYPQFMLDANESIKMFQNKATKDAAKSFWLVVIQDDRLCVALVENGHWRAVNNVIAAEDVSSQLQAMINRTRIHYSTDGHYPILVKWLASTPYRAIRVAGFQVVHISEKMKYQKAESLPAQFDELEAA